MLANKQGQVFAGQRIDSPGDVWQMPQGGIDPGEEPRDAALRELWEETGVTENLAQYEAETAGWVHYDLPHELVPKLWKGRYRGQKQRWFLIRFTGSDDQIDIDTEHPEFSRWAWLHPRELVQKIVPFKRDVYSQVIAELGNRLV